MFGSTRKLNESEIGLEGNRYNFNTKFKRNLMLNSLYTRDYSILENRFLSTFVIQILGHHNTLVNLNRTLTVVVIVIM